MATKTRTSYQCSNCGRRSPRYMGRCPACGEFNTMVEEVTEVSKAGTRSSARQAQARDQAQRLGEITFDAEDRITVPIGEFNRVLGGGIVLGSITLIGGDPGIGKSTVVLQAAAMIAATAGRVLYVSGEESARQIKMRADRMGVQADDLYLLTETHLAAIFEQIERLDPVLVVIDSIQTVYTDDSDSAPGSVTQVRECASRLQMLAKTTGTSVFLIGHVTKEGAIAGPRVLEHIVDTVLYLEGDPFQAYRLLRSVKNRFGATSEVGVFEMTGEGMTEVTNPSEMFLAERVLNAPGTSIAVSMEGTRPLLCEMQALTSPTTFGNPRRTPNGVDYNRLLLVSAVLTRRLGLKLHEQDIFVNVIGGLKIDEPASDLAMALALASSYYDKALPPDMAFVGEVGLSGEVRGVAQLPARLNEAQKIGFKRVMIPKARRPLPDLPRDLKVIEVRHLGEALAHVMPRE